MGVNSLWDILGPTSRTVKLEALTRKKLAVDASIWIYQFLKAVRDSEGNTLHQSHIVGFFRRICKLLYFGIQPIFVFDGGAPVLKRETINKRRERREGKRENATETAQRLLAILVQRQQQEHRRSKEDEMVYFEDLPNQHPKFGANSNNKLVSPSKMTSTSSNKRFIPKDEYHLPELKKIKVNETDERLMPEEEFNELTLDAFDIVDGIDINSVDPKSSEFAQLPMSTQYTILSHLRLKSRLRMGFTKEQLEDIFSNSMDFSKFQIQQVQKRNFFTQRLMDVSGMGDEGNATKRIAGEKDKKYALVRTDDGWSLSLQQDTPEALGIDRDPDISDEVKVLGQKPVSVKQEHGATETGGIEDGGIEDDAFEDGDSEDEFEDVLVEKHQPPEETQEERDFNKAVIESIYDQYADKDITKNDESKPEAKAQQQEKKATSGEQKDGLASDDLLGLNFGNSLLFGGISETPSEGGGSMRDTVREPVREPVRERPNIPSPDNKQEHDIIEVEKMVDNDDDNQPGQDKSRMQVDSIPSWFNDKIDKSSFEFKPMTNQVADNPNVDNEDEDAGLIPWGEAKDMIGVHSESSDDEFEEVELVELVKPQEQSGQVKEDDKSLERLENPEDKTNFESPVERAGSEVKEVEGIEVQARSPSDPSPSDPSPSETSNTNTKPPILDYVFNDDEEQLAEKQLISEEIDHEKLKNAITTNLEIPINTSGTSITEEQLLQERLQKQKRDSEEVTQAMINDVQELLRRFGIPFITAPMEAEAQCAELHKLGLVDGIITDDSDCFLFGGDRIYKNMFNQKQYVECYLKDDISYKLGLDQTRLIELGLLLGSDYTEGIKGIGPVLAMEILAEFNTLNNFKTWFDDNTLRGINDNSSGLKKNLLARIKSGKLYLSSLFPDQVVFEAYTSPQVDNCKDPFKWGVPDLDQIRSFLMYNVGWSQSRVDEVMVPLIRDMNKKLREGTQSSIGEFFPASHQQYSKQIQVGKRMKAAADKLHRKLGNNNK